MVENLHFSEKLYIIYYTWQDLTGCTGGKVSQGLPVYLALLTLSNPDKNIY